jgi:hypothetical protein
MTTVRTCRVCGCTEDNACVVHDPQTGQIDDACLWVEADLCCACIPGASTMWQHPSPASIAHAAEIREAYP